MFMNLFLYFYTIFCLMFLSSFVNIIWINRVRLVEIEKRLQEIKAIRNIEENHSLHQKEHVALIQERQIIDFPKKVLRVFLLVVAIIAIRNIILIEPLYLFGFRVGFIVTIIAAAIIGYIYNYILKKLGVEI